VARLHRWMSLTIHALNVIGALLVLVEAGWITYGVFVRYVLRDPDEMVTEATALLLVPLAFVGMAYALQRDAYPKVTLLLDALPPAARRAITLANMVLITLIGAFFTLVAGSAAYRTYLSGASSDILLWPEFIFWTPVAIFVGAFTAQALLQLADHLSGRSGLGTP